MSARDAVLLHREAMALADEADAAKRRHDVETAGRALMLALHKESEAASLVEEEPSRSVLLRSAASLAYEIGRMRDAERLIARALVGEPSAEIAEELRDLLEQVYFARHLNLRGVELLSDEFQLSIAGESVGYGMARTERFVRRIDDTQKLIYRTAERQAKLPFRESARPPKTVRGEIEVYVTVPRAASMAVTFRLARPHGQQTLAPELRPADVITEMLTCLDLLNEGKDKELKARIESDAYFRNFVAIAKQIAPDGKAVKLVGFTAENRASPVGEPVERRVAFHRPARTISLPVADDSEAGVVTLRGQLLLADDRRKAVKSRRQSAIVIVGKRKEHRVRVPPGMMADVVRPLWGARVVATVSPGHPPVLRDIRDASKEPDEDP